MRFLWNNFMLSTELQISFEHANKRDKNPELLKLVVIFVLPRRWGNSHLQLFNYHKSLFNFPTIAQRDMNPLIFSAHFKLYFVCRTNKQMKNSLEKNWIKSVMRSLDIGSKQQ